MRSLRAAHEDEPAQAERNTAAARRPVGPARAACWKKDVVMLRVRSMLAAGLLGLFALTALCAMPRADRAARGAEIGTPSTVAERDSQAFVPTAAEAFDEAFASTADAELDSPPDVSSDEAAALGNDELWFISSRCPRHEPNGSIRLHYWRYDAGHWQTATLEEFTSADPALPVCFHVHGNRVNLCQANLGGWRYYQAFTEGCVPRPPLRFVIFSWPSDGQVGRSLNDVRLKAVRAECHAFYLAWVVDRLPAEARISMVGYSYGARLIGGALHLLGGGSLRGQGLVDRTQAEPHAIRTVFLAAALDDDHLLPGRSFGAATTQIDRLLVACNRQDRTLKWYPGLYRFTLRPSRGQQAMGYAGFAGIHCVPWLYGRVEHRDVSCLVGNAHEWHGFEHLGGTLLERMRQYVYFEGL
jgi:hypothetical protein